ncbi:MAG: hypothetical protein HWN68_10895 [Desulfobacterales bacterium]|nr:hypothetical protein [Desulfobacterales bacterium]
MSTTIRVSDEVLADLHKMQQPRESYNDLLVRLIHMAQPVLEAAELMSEVSSIRRRLEKEDR